MMYRIRVIVQALITVVVCVFIGEVIASYAAGLVDEGVARTVLIRGCQIAGLAAGVWVLTRSR